jgi:UDP:flavonoid glycosyltransferase YjiC (YdhE family)
MLIVPFAHDQPDNAARAERLGVARAIYPQHYTAARVRHALAALLANERVSSRAAAVGAQVSAENGGLDAAKALERLTSQPGIRKPQAEA